MLKRVSFDQGWVQHDQRPHLPRSLTLRDETGSRLCDTACVNLCASDGFRCLHIAPATMAAASEATFMKGNVIDGKAVAAKIREEVAAKVTELKEKYKRVSQTATNWRLPTRNDPLLACTQRRLGRVRACGYGLPWGPQTAMHGRARLE
jgi:hypothetical protein